MIGGPGDPGIMFNTMTQIFKIRDKMMPTSSTIRISFLEIYNETIKDLIVPTTDILDLREDPVKGTTVAGLSEVEVESAQEILEVLTFGNKNRT